MVLTNDINLPTEEELTVQEVNVSSAVLRAASFHLGKYCENVNNEFMLCRAENGKDPRKCLQEGKAVTSCSLEFFRKMKQACRQQFEMYAECVDKSSTNFKLSPCRKSQAVYDGCMLEKLGLEREHWGYFSKLKVHDSSRPKPPPPEIQVFPDATPGLPADYPRNNVKYGARRIHE
uniref:NADH dehydrogenase [ubiquinone] 1 alpha subcomplex subunit 8 n=1 Tax=Lygus hesperus TaxID=30085 RepID=A0A0A9WYK5_LYGHE